MIPSKKSTKESSVKKQQCEVKTELACNNQIVRRLTGPKKGDPVFWCCIGCHAYLKRSGVRTKEAT